MRSVIGQLSGPYFTAQPASFLSQRRINLRITSFFPVVIYGPRASRLGHKSTEKNPPSR